MRKKIIILGATGSIGKGTLDVIRENRDKFEITAISAHNNKDALITISNEFDIPILALSGRNSDDAVIA